MCGNGHAPILTRLCFRRGPPGGRGCRHGTKAGVSDQDRHQSAEQGAERARNDGEARRRRAATCIVLSAIACLDYRCKSTFDHEAVLTLLKVNAGGAAERGSGALRRWRAHTVANPTPALRGRQGRLQGCDHGGVIFSNRLPLEFSQLSCAIRAISVVRVKEMLFQELTYLQFAFR